MKSLLVRFLKDETGATAIEYGLIAAGIALAIIFALNQLGLSLIDVFTRLAQRIGG
jgi:pilus assembly protein Flp/PilA